MHRTILLVVALLAILAGAVVFAWFGLTGGHEVALGMHGWTAMALGTLFTLVVGVGLMALMFYSSRHGYDEAARGKSQRMDDQQR